jgi:hypothetical protein
MLSFIDWEKICNDPIAGLNLMIIVGALIVVAPLLGNVGDLFHEMHEYFFAPRKHPWISGWGRKEY